MPTIFATDRENYLHRPTINQSAIKIVFFNNFMIWIEQMNFSILSLMIFSSESSKISIIISNRIQVNECCIFLIKLPK